MKKSLVFVAVLALVPALVSLTAHAAPPRQGEHPFDWCIGGDGTIIDQPPGSQIQACCTVEGCMICDADWENCHYEPSYRRPGGILPDGGAAQSPQGGPAPFQVQTPGALRQ